MSKKTDALVLIFVSPLFHPFAIGLPMVSCVVAAVAGFAQRAGSQSLVMLAVAGGLYLLGCVWGAIEAVSDGIEDHQMARYDRKRYEERWKEFSYWFSEFETQLGFYEALGGKRLKDMKDLFERANTLLVDRAAWEQGRRPEMSATQMSSDLAAMVYWLQDGCNTMAGTAVR